MGPDQTEDSLREKALGRRVACGGDRATVRFVGLVPPTEGLWLGVEWDNPERGKHDGSHKGIHYFTCSNPSGGSFVRPGKASFGVDYLTAVQSLYVIDAEEVTSAEINISTRKLEWGRIKDRSFETLPTLLLGNHEVNGAGEDGEIRKTTPHVQFLDLGGTLMSSWEDVAAITKQLESLHTLQLNNNRLSLPSSPSTLCQAFLSLKVLALNSCDLTWTQILECAPMWPKLEDLFVEENNITELQRPVGVLQCLKNLNLSHNALQQDSLLSIAALPRLEQLTLLETGLSDIRFDDVPPGSVTSMFPALKVLNVDQNNITEWSVVDELSKLPGLVQFCCRGNRLASSDGNPRTANQLIIAKLGNLQVLNSCEITSDERRGAELDYIKMFGLDWLKTGASAAFTSTHPRYLTLIDKYGAPEEGELKKPVPFALKNQLLKIQFVFPDDVERKPIEKKLPASMEVQKVKGLLYRLLKVPAADLKLAYSSPKMEGTEFEIDSDLKTLQFYSIEDGDQMIVRWS